MLLCQITSRAANASSSTQTPQGQPCSTGVGNNTLTIPEHSQHAVSRMPKARRSRLSLTRCAGCATFHAAPTINQSGRGRCNQFSRFCIRIFHAQRAAKRYARQIAVNRKRLAAYPNSARSTLSDRGWQQPLDHHKAQPARRVKDAEGTAKPLVLDSARWLGYLAAVHQTPQSPTAPRQLPFQVNLTS